MKCPYCQKKCHWATSSTEEIRFIGSQMRASPQYLPLQQRKAVSIFAINRFQYGQDTARKHIIVPIVAWLLQKLRDKQIPI